MIGLSRTLAVGLADRSVRMNTAHPSAVERAMAHSGKLIELLADPPDLVRVLGNAVLVGLTDAAYITRTLPFLVSDEARHITGATLALDAGAAMM